MKHVLFICLVFAGFSLSGQGYKIGVRAGLNYSTFSGPLEGDGAEDYSLGSGIHFGINYTYYPVKNIGFRAEVLYIQRGTKQNYDGNGFHLIRLPNGTKLFEKGQAIMILDVTMAYFSIPLTAQFQLTPKFEVYAGGSIDFLVGPSGRGKVDFTSTARPLDIFFIQSYDFKYGSDLPGQANFNLIPISVIVDGDVVDLPKIVGAYYQFDQVDGNRFNSFNINAIAGINYFLNPGFYVGARLEYGFLDLTNDRMDISLENVTNDGDFILRDDNDLHIGFNLSFGFRF